MARDIKHQRDAIDMRYFRTTPPTALADFFVHLGYLFLIFAAYYQYEIISESM